MSVFIIVAVFATLFLLAFATKRRFGPLGLGLAAGVLLAQYAASITADALVPFQQYFGDFTTLTVAKMLLTVLPSLILLTAGPKFKKPLKRIISSSLYAVFATVLLLPYLVDALGITNDVFAKIIDLQPTFIVIGVVFAVIDLMMKFTKKPLPDKKSK
jgi:hypothetical protein